MNLRSFFRSSALLPCLLLALGGAACSSSTTTPAASAGPDVSGGDGAAADTVKGDGGTDASAPAGISGTWSSNFGGYEEISDKAWNDMIVTKLDLAGRIAITQNSASDKYNPSKFNKIAFTAPKDGSFYYCYVDFGLGSADLAEASTKTADDSKPDKSGCAGFPWAKLTRTDPIDIAGTWTNGFGEKENISSRTWNAMMVSLFDNQKRWAITQNPPDDPYNPSKYSKLVWTAPSASGFYYCTVEFGQDTLALAQDTTKTADDSKPDKGGCAGFSWTKVSP